MWVTFLQAMAMGINRDREVFFCTNLYGCACSEKCDGCDDQGMWCGTENKPDGCVRPELSDLKLDSSEEDGNSTNQDP